MHSPRALDLSPPGGGVNRPKQIHYSPHTPPPNLPSGSSVNNTAISHHGHPNDHEGTVSPPAFQPQPPSVTAVPPVSAAAAFIAAAAAAAAASTSPPSDHENHHAISSAERPRIRSRRGRGGRSSRSERMSAAAIGGGSPRSLSEMSVRGLDLLRYATLAPDGTYRLLKKSIISRPQNTGMLEKTISTRSFVFVFQNRKLSPRRNISFVYSRNLSGMPVLALKISVEIQMLKLGLDSKLGVSNVNGCKLVSTSRISIASKGMPSSITRERLAKSFHVLYVRRSSPDQTK